MALNILPGDINNLIQREQNFRGEVVQTGAKLISDFGSGVADAYKDTERNLITGVSNAAGDVLHTGRYVAKNVVALVDNTQDNITTIIQDIRVDVTNTIQIGLLIAGIGIAAFMLLYGDKLIDRGINIQGLELF